MDFNQCLVLETNGFIINAGILGFLRLLEQVKAVKGVDYDYNEYQLFIDKHYLSHVDLAQAYIETCNALFYDVTHYARMRNALKKTHAYADWVERETTWTKEEKNKIQQGLADIVKAIDVLTTTKSLSNACRWLQQEGVLEEDLPALVKEVKQTKDFSEKIKGLLLIEQCLEIPKVKETLCLVGVSLRVLSHFWMNKAFIKNSQGNTVILSDQNMKALLDEGLIQPFKEQLNATQFADKTCAECDCPLPKKSKTPNLSFMNDMVDDIAKKPSAFWNFDKNQALLCDHCAFLYVLMPLGFASMGHEMVFVNANTTIEAMVLANSTYSSLTEGQVFNWNHLCQQLIQRCVEKQILQSDNIQIVIRSTEKGKERYRFEVLSYEALRLLEKNQKLLEGLSKCYSFKLKSGDYWNVSEAVILSLLNYSHLYPILHQLLRLSLDSEFETSAKIQLPLVYAIQQSKRQLQLEGEIQVKSKQLYFATKNAMEDGKALYRHLTYVAKKDTSSVVYRLLNAAQTNNKYEFLNTVLRLHTSYGLPLSVDFMKLLNDSSFFKDMAYAYLLGLQGVAERTTKEGVTVNDEN